MKNVNRKKQLFFDFGRDYEANLDNFFFSSKNKLLKSELENFLNGAVSQNIFLTAPILVKNFAASSKPR